jgi:hypothetical protein
MNRAFSTNKTEGNSRKSLTRKPEGKTPLGRPKRRWENIIKIMNSEGRMWTGLIRPRI